MRKPMMCLALLALAAALTAGAFAVPDGVACPAARSFMALMDGYGLRYDFTAAGPDGEERVDFTVSGERTAARLTMYFDALGEEADIRCWSVVEYDPANAVDAVELCNALNASYRWARFYADTGDNTINAAIDVAFTESDAAQLCMKAAVQLASIVDDAWPLLEPLAK